MTAKLWHDDPEHNYFIWEFDTEEEARAFFDNAKGDASLSHQRWGGGKWEVTLGHDPDDMYDYEMEERRSIMMLAMERNPDLAFTASDMEDW